MEEEGSDHKPTVRKSRRLAKQRKANRGKSGSPERRASVAMALGVTPKQSRAANLAVQKAMDRAVAAVNAIERSSPPISVDWSPKPSCASSVMRDGRI